MACKWCHNPESLKQQPQETFNPQKCIKCGRCDNSACNNNSERASDNCPAGARETIGYEISVPELMKEIHKDQLFYEQSGGGVTFSGGEPFFQPEFLLEALTICKKNYINTAIDTSGFCEKDVLFKAAETTNYFLYDLKFFDNTKHEKFCGVSNGIILKNLEHLAERKTKILIRIPVIPGVNDDVKEMNGIFQFIKDKKNIEAVHLLPYHNIHGDKYKRLGMFYELCNENGLEVSGDESPNMAEIKSLFETKFRTKVGG